MGLDAPRARFFRGRAENIAAAAAGRFQHPGIEIKDKMMSVKIKKRFKDSRSGSRVKSACVEDSIPINIFLLNINLF